MNQLFDGCGDKMSLTQLRQRYVPINSTSMCLGVQPQPFFKALTAIGKTVWMDSGFSENVNFKRGRYGRNRGISNYDINIRVNNFYFSKSLML